MTRPVGAPVPSLFLHHTPLKLLLSPLNQNEKTPAAPPMLNVARTLRGSLGVTFPLSVTPPERQTTPAPDCLQIILPMKALEPPAPVTFHVPAADSGEGG